MAVSVSERFKTKLAEGYTLTAKVEVITATGAVIADTGQLNVVGGRIDCNASASFRRWLSGLQLVDATGELVPTTAAHMFSPIANNELLVYLGLVEAPEDGYILQGVFHLAGCETSDTAEGLLISLDAYDRGRKYSRSKRTIPKRFDQNAAIPIHQSIASLLQDAFIGTVVNIVGAVPSHLTTELVLDAGGDPWEFARELATSMGYELFFNRSGDLVLQKVPDPNDPTAIPHWTYQEGATSTILQVGRTQSNDEVYNGWIITGENPATGEPVRALVVDEDPNSPIRWGGPYGKVPGFHTDEKVRSVAQAIEAGIAKLNQNKGVAEGVVFSCLPNPAMEPRDFVRLIRERSGFPETGQTDLLMVDSFSLPLTAAGGAMTVTCRQRRL